MSIPRIEEISGTTESRRYLQEVSDGLENLEEEGNDDVLYELLKFDEMMELRLRSAEYNEYEDAEKPEKNFDWNVTKYDDHSMEIQLYFENPEAISRQSNDFDVVRIEFINTTLIYDFVGQELEEGTYIEKQVP